MDWADWFEQRPALTIVVILMLTIVAAAVMYVFARLLIKSLNDSAKWEEPLTTLMLILGTISVVALVGALFTKSESAYTIAATGVGAFAGALSTGAQKAIGEWKKDNQPAPPIAPVPLGPVEPEPEPPVFIETVAPVVPVVVDALSESEGVTDDDEWDNDEDLEGGEGEDDYVLDDEDLAEEAAESNEPPRP